MQVARVTAGAGRGWVVRGFALMRRYPAAMMLVTFCWWLVLMLSTALPVVGPFAQFVLMPFLSVGVMHAVRAAAEQRMPVPTMLFQALRDRQGRVLLPLLGMGVLNAAGTVIAIGASALLDQGLLFEIVTGQARADDPRLTQAPLLLSASMFVLVMLPIQMALWYAPVFCAWHGLPMVKSMFFSFVAVMRNRWAFLQYAVAWLVIAMGASLLLMLTFGLVGQSVMTRVSVSVPLTLLMLTAVFCSYWPTYREVIVDDGGPTVG